MKLSTKTVASLLVSATLEADVPGVIVTPTKKQRGESHFDRILHRHDRKGELCADLLGLSVYEFRRLQKTMKFEEIIRRCGIDDRHSFIKALTGKLRDELHRRGWSRSKIDMYVLRKSLRLSNSLQVA